MVAPAERRDRSTIAALQGKTDAALLVGAELAPDHRASLAPVVRRAQLVAAGSERRLEIVRKFAQGSHAVPQARVLLHRKAVAGE